MTFRDFYVTIVITLLLIIVGSTHVSFSSAQVMQSTNYRIESDSVNIGGGSSSSTNYSLQSTAGETATGDLSGVSYNLRSGYQQMTDRFISLSTPASVTMTPSIPGIGGGTANGSTTVTVTTDSSAGYTLTISASQSPALTKGADSIADYVPAGAPDFTFTTGAVNSHFGYSPSGVDTSARFKNNVFDTCATGSNETALACWDGLDVVAETVAERTSANTPNGSTTTINFRVGVGGSVVQTAGTYTATTTLTALSL